MHWRLMAMATHPPQVDVGFGGRKDSLPLLRDDKELSLRIFLDGRAAEVRTCGCLDCVLGPTRWCHLSGVLDGGSCGVDGQH